jgi:antitoxin (DNA-binding transcriptional repressor) of toxin-antitoxin stability system
MTCLRGGVDARRLVDREGVGMRFISVHDLRSRPARAWCDLSAEGEMIVTRNGKPVAILLAANESNLEELLAAFRQARAIGAVARLQRAATERGAEAMGGEIDREIWTARRVRAG